MFKPLAKKFAQSAILKSGRLLWKQNQKDINLPLSKLEKIIIGMYLITNDYVEGLFPPTFNDQQKAYEAEIAYRFSLPGVSVSSARDSEMRKPFWFGKYGREYLKSFIELTSVFESLGIQPPQKLLELGCGTGWLSEFLALMGFNVIGTSISPYDIDDAKTRIKSIEEKHLQVSLNFLAMPMESVAEATWSIIPFDAVFVFEALHHAYDWRSAITSSYSCLKPGGWLLICNEPNIVHTYVSYRIARLSNTHEIGFKRSDLIAHLQQTGFTKIKILKNRISYFIKPHWIAAQR